MATFNETRVPTSTKYVAEQAIEIAKWSKTFQTFCWYSSVFAIENLPRNLNYQSFLTSNRPFGGYFQWNACTDFHKIDTWTSYTDAKLIKNISNFLVALLPFFCRKSTGNSKFSGKTSNRPFGGYFQWNTCTDFHKIDTWSSYTDAKLIKNISNFLVAHLRFCCRKTT